MKSVRTKKKKFSLLFDKYYKSLFNYALKVIECRDAAESLVQETFIKLWENIENIKENERSIESYLITVLKNKIIDDYRKNQTQKRHYNLYKLNNELTTDIDSQWELEKEIEKIYNSLPQKTSDIFKLSRDKGLTYVEIATLKKISIKTVEFHISKALYTFKNGLKDYL